MNRSLNEVDEVKDVVLQGVPVALLWGLFGRKLRHLRVPEGPS